MVGVSPHHKVDFEVSCHDTAAELSKQRETQFGLEGGFSCFSGSASMSFSKTASSIATCHRRSAFEFNTHKFLDPRLVTLIRDEGICPAEIERKIGHFHVTMLTLGGVYQKSYVAHMSKGESKETILAKVYAGFFSITRTSSLGSQPRTSKIDEKTLEKVSCQDGHTQIWLGATKENFEERKPRWAETVSQENAYGVGYRLVPIWKLISMIDPKKGKAYEEFLREKWNLQNENFQPTSFFDKSQIQLLSCITVSA